MRILFTTTGGLGHVHPTLPLAATLRERGHTVAFAGPLSTLRPIVEPLGFEPFGVGRDGVDAEVDGVMREVFSLPGAAAERVIMTKLFIGINVRRMVPDLIELCERWSPDLLLHETGELGATIAGERLGIPHCCIQAGSHEIGELAFPEALRELDLIRAGAGLPPDPELTAVARHLYLVTTPRSLRSGAPLPATAHELRPATIDATSADSAVRWPAATRPRIYATLGSEAPRQDRFWPNLYRVLGAGLGSAGAVSLLTVGRHRDPAELGPLPLNVRVERYVPQTRVLPTVDAVLSHGGHNTLLAGLAEGLPQVILPLFADQPVNASRAAAAGAAVALSARDVTPSQIAAAVDRALDDPSIRQAAGRIRDEIAAMPGLESAATAIELVAAGTGFRRLVRTQAPSPFTKT